MDDTSEEVELEETGLVTTDVTTASSRKMRKKLKKRKKIEPEDDEDETTSDESHTPTHSLLRSSNGKKRRGERMIPSSGSSSRRCILVSLVSGVLVIVFLVLATVIASSWLLPPTSGPTAKEDSLALTPPMGWNSWNKFGCHDLSEALVRSTADALLATGLADAGYVYVNLDDCWQIDRDSSGVIQADASEGRFKSGMKDLADYLHGKGLKFGLYTDMGTLTCQRRPGSYKHEESDVKTYASWGVDFIKNDDCYVYPTLEVAETYQRMWDAIAASGQPMIHSVKATLLAEHAHLLSHMRRIGPDIHPEWDSVVSLVDQVTQEKLWQFAQPGFWNDLDMLEVGNGDLTEEENIAHFALWCAFKAPLILGNDVRNVSTFVLDLLTHDELLSVLKDPLGKSVQLVQVTSPADGSAKSQAVSKTCKSEYDQDHAWLYDEKNGLLKHEESGKCLTVGWRDYLYVEECDRNATAQHWLVDFDLRRINHTLDKCLTTSPQAGAGSKVRRCSGSASHTKYWLPFNDVFHIQIVKESTYSFKNSKNKCLAVGGNPELQIFAGPLTGNRHVVVLLNRDNKPQEMTLRWEDLQRYSTGLDAQTLFAVRDLYRRQELGQHQESFTSAVDAHSALMVTLKPVLRTLS